MHIFFFCFHRINNLFCITFVIFSALLSHRLKNSTAYIEFNTELNVCVCVCVKPTPMPKKESKHTLTQPLASHLSSILVSGRKKYLQQNKKKTLITWLAQQMLSTKPKQK